MESDVLKEKKRRLEALKSSRSAANCTKNNSTQSDVLREAEIEDLEYEIRKIEEGTTH